jgi:hypothetical protein
MKRLILGWLFILVIAATASAQFLQTDRLASWESGYSGYGTTGYTWTGKFLGADTITTVLWFGSFKLNPEANDVTFIVRSDTSLGVATDTMSVTAILYPIVDNRGARRVTTMSPYYGDVQWDMGITPTRCLSGTAFTAFTVNPDSSYSFHHTTWWGGMDMLGILGRWYTTTADSLYFDVIAQYMGNQ